MNFTPAELAQAVRRRVPDFVIDYDIDPVRQSIANSWPRIELDDSASRRDWGWSARFNLDAMTTTCSIACKMPRFPKAGGSGDWGLRCRRGSSTRRWRQGWWSWSAPAD